MKQKGDTIPKQPILLSIFRTRRKSDKGVTSELQRKLRDHGEGNKQGQAWTHGSHVGNEVEAEG